jgi:eukaryotic translation initiation factor 2C
MKKADLILVILPFPAMDIKKQVKRWGDVDYGVATQCVIAPKVTMANLQAQKNNDQYVNNVVLKYEFVGFLFKFDALIRLAR